MASVSEMMNVPTPILLGGRICKLRRLDLAEVYGETEQEVLTEYVQTMKDIAASLTGSDKVDYLVQMSQSMPAGAELTRLASQRIGSITGMMKLFKKAIVPEADPKTGQPLPIPDLIPLLNENKNLVKQLTKAIVGFEVNGVKPEDDSKEGPLARKDQTPPNPS